MKKCTEDQGKKTMTEEKIADRGWAYLGWSNSTYKKLYSLQWDETESADQGMRYGGEWRAIQKEEKWNSSKL